MQDVKNKNKIGENFSGKPKVAKAAEIASEASDEGGSDAMRVPRLSASGGKRDEQEAEVMTAIHFPL